MAAAHVTFDALATGIISGLVAGTCVFFTSRHMSAPAPAPATAADYYERRRLCVSMFRDTSQAAGHNVVPPTQRVSFSAATPWALSGTDLTTLNAHFTTSLMAFRAGGPQYAELVGDATPSAWVRLGWSLAHLNSVTVGPTSLSPHVSVVDRWPGMENWLPRTLPCTVTTEPLVAASGASGSAVATGPIVLLVSMTQAASRGVTNALVHTVVDDMRVKNAVPTSVVRIALATDAEADTKNQLEDAAWTLSNQVEAALSTVPASLPLAIVVDGPPLVAYAVGRKLRCMDRRRCVVYAYDLYRNPCRTGLRVPRSSADLWGPESAFVCGFDSLAMPSPADLE